MRVGRKSSFYQVETSKESGSDRASHVGAQVHKPKQGQHSGKVKIKQTATGKPNTGAVWYKAQRHVSCGNVARRGKGPKAGIRGKS